MRGENMDGGFMGFSNQTMLGEITSSVYIDNYSTKELKKNVEQKLPQDDERLRSPRANNDGGAGLLHIIMLALWIKDWGHEYLGADFGEVGG
jgi:hypothetical protein